MFFLIFNNANILFIKKKLIYKTYTRKEIFYITCLAKFTYKNKFTKKVLNRKVKAFWSISIA